MSGSHSPINVGIAGLGRSGWDIHARALLKMAEQYKIATVADFSPERRAQAAAESGCRALESFEQLCADPEVELLIVATPSHLHPEHSIAALKAGKNVVCEKPMAATTEAADGMIAAARESKRTLAPFQNYRYNPDVLKIREVIASGALGSIVMIRMAVHGFSRRWDWQTLKEYNGGSLNNTASHFIDLALQFIGPKAPKVFCDLARTPLTSGDAEDCVKVVLRAAGAPLVDIEVSSACAYPDELWQVMGTRGGLKGTNKALRWKYVENWDALPPRPLDRKPTENRSYNSEQLPWKEETWERPAEYASPVRLFYADLHRSLRERKPLAVTPRSVRRQIAILEKCHKLSPV